MKSAKNDNQFANEYLLYDKAKRLVLVLKIPGKKYLDAELHKDRSAQKGETCWWTVIGDLRPRLGGGLEIKLEELKLEPEASSEIKQEQEESIARLKEARMNEKIFSSFRKTVTKLDEKQHKQKALLDTISMMLDKCVSEIDHSIAKMAIQFYSQFVLDPLCPDKESVNQDIQLLHEFVSKSQGTSFEDFIERQYIENYISSAVKALTDLDKVQNVSLIYNKIFSGRKRSTLSLQELRSLYHRTMIHTAAEMLGLQHIRWNPYDDQTQANGYEGLKNALIHHGALYVGGFIGPQYQPDEAKIETAKQLPEGYIVHFWKKRTTGEESDEGRKYAHAVLVVGVQEIKISSGPPPQFQKTVLYRDPNDVLEPGKPQKVYRISYDKFLKNIHPLYQSAHSFKQTCPKLNALNIIFTYGVDAEYAAKLEKDYKYLFKKTG